MKNTVSINIGGTLFHIEEEANIELKNYLHSIQKYFASFPDSSEILSDIENRIAEKFLQKLKNENTQVITSIDVNELIKSMGSVADFEAIEDPYDNYTEPEKEGFKETISPESNTLFTTNKEKRFYRDTKRKIFGGVAAGIGNYFAVDSIWIRLGLLFIFLFSVPTSGILGLHLEEFFAFLSGTSLLIYIAAWIAFPGSNELEDNGTVKKLYRNTDQKVIGGVASGISAYFGVDKGIIRFLWIISVFVFGSGLLAYLIMWFITPAAKTLTEKMEMQGQPITLSNIESNIKRNFDSLGKINTEGLLSKIVLLPFRLVASILEFLGRLFNKLGPVARVIAGLFLISIASILALGFITSLAGIFGLTNVPEGMIEGELPPFFRIIYEVPSILILALSLFLFVPVVAIFTIGLMLVSNKKLVGSPFWLTLAGIWVLGISGSVYKGVQFQRNFASAAEIERISLFAIKPEIKLDGTPNMNHHDEGTVKFYSIRLEPIDYQDSLQVTTTLVSRGRSKEDASKHASLIQYNPVLTGNVLHFPAVPVFTKEMPFRNQELQVKVSIPKNAAFKMTKSFFYKYSKLHHDHLPQLEKYDLDNEQLNWDQLSWKFNDNNELVCINFPEQFLQAESSNSSASFTEIDSFQTIVISGSSNIVIEKGDKYGYRIEGIENDVTLNTEGLSVQVSVNDKKGIADFKPIVENGALIINYQEQGQSQTKIVITTPELNTITASGGGTLTVKHFETNNPLKLSINGTIKADLDIFLPKLTLAGAGASNIQISGNIPLSEISLSDVAKIDATKAKTEDATLLATDASEIKIGEIINLKAYRNDAGKIITIQQ